jgi:pimeloyl-ACP methyl ester carboxylesterase
LSADNKIDARQPFAADAAEEWAQVGGLKVCFRRMGAGPPMVLVHGLLAYSFSWRFVAPVLAKQREIFALDMPGSGFSDCSPELDFRIRSAAQRLLGFMDAVGIPSCDLVGTSYGGATAIMAAALAPKRVRTLILVSPANPWSRIGRKRLAFLKNPIAASLFPKISRPLRIHGYFVRRMFGDPSRIAPDTIDGYGRALARRGVLEHAVQIIRTWREDMQELKDSLPGIADIPTLLVWGSKDRVVDPASAAFLARSLPRAQIAIVEGAGHLPYEEVPEEFSRLVLDFLARHSPAERTADRS